LVPLPTPSEGQAIYFTATLSSLKAKAPLSHLDPTDTPEKRLSSLAKCPQKTFTVANKSNAVVRNIRNNRTIRLRVHHNKVITLHHRDIPRRGMDNNSLCMFNNRDLVVVEGEVRDVLLGMVLFEWPLIV
jgi:hypothetical protein